MNDFGLLKIETKPNVGDLVEYNKQTAIVIKLYESTIQNYSGSNRLDVLLLIGLERIWTLWWPKKEETAYQEWLKIRVINAF